MRVFNVVVGPPGSGKTQFCREYAKPEDIVIDEFDPLTECAFIRYYRQNAVYWLVPYPDKINYVCAKLQGYGKVNVVRLDKMVDIINCEHCCEYGCIKYGSCFFSSDKTAKKVCRGYVVKKEKWAVFAVSPNLYYEVKPVKANLRVTKFFDDEMQANRICDQLENCVVERVE
jgi:hypothetical protein